MIFNEMKKQGFSTYPKSPLIHVEGREEMRNKVKNKLG